MTRKIKADGKVEAVLSQDYRQFLERDSLGSLLRRASFCLSAALSHVLEPYDLTPPQWVVLACLWRRDGQPVTYISRQVQQIGGTITGVLDRLEKRKFVKRKRDSADRRIYRVYLTERGAELVNELPQKVFGIWDRALKYISPEEKEKFSRFIDHGIANLEPDYQCSLPDCEDKLPANLSRILPPKSLGYRMKIYTLSLTRKFTEALEPYNVTTNHWVVLCRLWKQDGITTMEIGKWVDQVGGTLTGLLERMEERGLITRSLDSADKRRILVYLTADGQALYDRLPPIAAQILDESTAGLKIEDVDFMRETLRRIIRGLEESDKEVPVI